MAEIHSPHQNHHPQTNLRERQKQTQIDEDPKINRGIASIAVVVCRRLHRLPSPSTIFVVACHCHLQPIVGGCDCCLGGRWLPLALGWSWLQSFGRD
ncbi:unnamed protein product [Prunus armeniaca]|uniref:Uncharacterized protein n=1 Tax=Prunus armeniaca TaxID=36596 RepID=A0A6J5U0V8_PRUAR|nr:unnamed protein product [Prunus armeniaca]CAB4298612.1 unnamed protein product [Prunus armeniaca]